MGQHEKFSPGIIMSTDWSNNIQAGYFLVIVLWVCAAGLGCIFMTELTIKGLHFPQSYSNGVTHFPAFGEKKTLENRNSIMGRLVVLLF